MKEILISREEYLERKQLIQIGMREKDLNALLVYSWKRGQVKYLTGYTPNYVANVAMVLIPREGELKLFIRFPFDLERAERLTYLDDIQASGNLENIARDVARELLALGIKKGKIGLVGGDQTMDEIPFSLVEQLRILLPEVNFSDERSMLVAMRMLKSSTELDALRFSAKVADLGLSKAKEVLAPGMTELQLIAAVEHTLRENGAEYHLAVIAAPGSRKLIGPPTKRVIQPGEDVIVEIGVEIGGYWTQVAGVLFSTQPTPEQKAITKAVYKAYQHAAGQLVIGQSCSGIARELQQFLNQAGYGEYTEQDFGHGIGLDLPEPPKLEEGDDTLLKAGMVVVAHPAVRVPGVGGAFIGGTVLVTEEGPELLHDLSILF